MYFIGSDCEPIHQYTSGTNNNCFDSTSAIGAPQWFDMYNTQNKIVQIHIYNITIQKGDRFWGREGVLPSMLSLDPNQKCTYGFNPVDEPLSLDQTNMSMTVSYTYDGKNYTISSPQLTDVYNDSRTWQYDGNKWVFSEQNTAVVPEFPLSIPVLLIGITSLVIFSKIRLKM
ncbi:MAG: hypothetical protein ACYDAJ_00395 [Nitrosotalea sp.]